MSFCAVFRCCFGVVVVGVTLRMKFDMSCLCTEQCLLFRYDSRQCSGCCKSMLVCCLSRVSERNGVSAGAIFTVRRALENIVCILILS